MKTIKLTLIALVCSCVTTLMAQEFLNLYQNNMIANQWNITSLDSITFSSENNYMNVYQSGIAEQSIEIAAIDSISFTNRAVYIKYASNQVYVNNPFESEGVLVTVSGTQVTVNAQVNKQEIIYLITGSCPNGAFKLYSNYKTSIMLYNLTLTNTVGPAINIQSSKSCSMQINGINTLTDGTVYTTSSEDQKATVFSEGQLKFSGTGTLNVVGNNRHAICSDDYIELNSGNITISKAVNDAINVNDYFEMNGGNITITNTGGDGIDAGSGYIEIKGGIIDITSTAADVKGIKCDSIIMIKDGTINMTVSGASSKAIKTNLNYIQTGGNVTINTSGDVVITSGETSYCTAIKCDKNFSINAGTLTITSSGKGGKGISTNRDLEISGGDITITTTGSGTTYTNASNQTDAYNSTCITSDANITITAGNLILKSTGAGGKCINADGALALGQQGDNDDRLKLSATTTGSKFSVSSGWNGGGGQGGGKPNDNADYCNPKAIKCDGNMTVYSGTYTIRCANDGGEGLESKAVLTINGGLIDIETYDDAINASTAIVVNDGYVYAKASNNDGMDSNGTFTFNGGIVISSGATSPEGAFDCDNNSFLLNGGILIGTGGSSSTPTSASQSYLSSTNTTLTAGKYLQVLDANGNEILSYLIPRTISSGRVLISTPNINKGNTYTLKYGGTYTNGTEIWKGYTTGGTYSGGSTKNVSGS